LGQVFLNLLVNAAQALPEGQADRNAIRVRTAVSADGRVMIDVEDTGPGISPEHVRRLFTPFFTTKPVGVGTGLGLSICHRIVSGMNGHIEVDTAVGRGTTFRVIVPAAARTEPVMIQPQNVELSARRCRILVVDDEPMMGIAITRVLAAEHDVHTLTRGREMLDKLAAGERFDLLICDLMMPEVTGMELFEEIHRLYPAQSEKMIFMTGGAFTARARAFLDETKCPTIDKPFNPKDLRAKVNARLRQS
jgi:CheY-like chemotaxis protein/anti-sigma regulatory factor (Ser/Thr protein kinase)